MMVKNLTSVELVTIIGMSLLFILIALRMLLNFFNKHPNLFNKVLDTIVIVKVGKRNKK
jgi:hypothetical protein